MRSHKPPSGRAVQISCEAWLRGRNVDASKENFVATGIIVFGFELFIGERLDHHEYQPILSGHMRWEFRGLTVVRC